MSNMRKIKMMTKGLRNTELHLRVTTGVSKSSSSNSFSVGRSRSDSSRTDSSVGLRMKSLMELRPRSIANRSWRPLDGINRDTTREDTRRVDLRAFLAFSNSPGFTRRFPIARISSAAYPGSFAKR